MEHPPQQKIFVSTELRAVIQQINPGYANLTENSLSLGYLK